MSDRPDIVAIETHAREAVEAFDAAVAKPDGDVPLSELMRLGAAGAMAQHTPGARST